MQMKSKLLKNELLKEASEVCSLKKAKGYIRRGSEYQDEEIKRMKTESMKNERQECQGGCMQGTERNRVK